MNKTELREARGRLTAFLESILPLMGRLERRQWGSFYVQGLLLEGGRKTAAYMAQTYGGDMQALQQFVSQSPWDHMLVRRELAGKMAEAAGPQGAFVLDDTGFPKKGTHSVGVARQYSGTLGKVGNCQIGVSVNYATNDGCFPLDFQLYLPKEWIDDTERRAKAGIPAEAVFKRKWEIGLEMIDRASEWIGKRIVTADAGYGAVSEFRAALAGRDLLYVVGITKETGVWLEPVDSSPPEYQGRGRPRKRHPDWPPPRPVFDVALNLPAESWIKVCWREGTKGPLTSRFAAIRVRPSHGHRDGDVKEKTQWLLIEWPAGASEPEKYWLSNLAEDAKLVDIVSWAKMRWWVEQNYLQLKDELGLDHFEGRSWLGWHHHVTLTMVAFDFLVLEGFRSKKNFWVWLDPATSETGDPDDSLGPLWVLSIVRPRDSRTDLTK